MAFQPLFCSIPTSQYSVVENPLWVGAAKNTGHFSLSCSQQELQYLPRRGRPPAFLIPHSSQLHVVDALFQAKIVEGYEGLFLYLTVILGQKFYPRYSRPNILLQLTCRSKVPSQERQPEKTQRHGPCIAYCL